MKITPKGIFQATLLVLVWTFLILLLFAFEAKGFVTICLFLIFCIIVFKNIKIKPINLHNCSNGVLNRILVWVKCVVIFTKRHVIKIIIFGILLSIWTFVVYKIGWNEGNLQPLILPNAFRLRADLLWKEANNWRISQGLKPFKLNDDLCWAARERLRNTSVNWSHDGFPEVAEKIYLKNTRFINVGENLLTDYKTEREGFEGWLNSPSHRSALSNPKFTESCIYTDGIHAVQLFGEY